MKRKLIIMALAAFALGACGPQKIEKNGKGGDSDGMELPDGVECMTDVNCDDRDRKTHDLCNNGECSNEQIDECDDGQTFDEASQKCVTEDKTCPNQPEGDLCNNYACNPVTGKLVPSPKCEVPDGREDELTSTCDEGSGQCFFACIEDDNACTTIRLNDERECEVINLNGVPCGDEESGLTCREGVCISVQPLTEPDAGAPEPTPDAAPPAPGTCGGPQDCQDNNLCTLNQCVDGFCMFPPRCNDFDPVTVDRCLIEPNSGAPQCAHELLCGEGTQPEGGQCVALERGGQCQDEGTYTCDDFVVQGDPTRRMTAVARCTEGFWQPVEGQVCGDSRDAVMCQAVAGRGCLVNPAIRNDDTGAGWSNFQPE